MPTSNYPSAYKQFKAITDLYKHSENKLLLGRFVYRYRLAKSFNEIVAEGIGRTLTGYNAILKVFLAYTAYEQLLKAASGLHVYQLGTLKENRVVDQELARRLRNNKKLIDSLINYSTDSELIGQLVAFRKAVSDDIVCVAYAIRNVFAHGDLTATSIGLALKAQRTTLLDLADFFLNYCNDNFTKCVDKLR
jgi:hypothetical protein